MRPDTKEEFIRNLCDSTRDYLIRQIPQMPEAWDGHQLRRFISAEFARQNTERARTWMVRYNREAAQIGKP